MTDQTNGSAEVRRVLNAIADEIVKTKAKAATSPSLEQVDEELANKPKALGSAHDTLTADAQQLMDTVLNTATKVGRMPPQPPTLRAKLGSVLVQFVRRALFWYSDQVNEANARVAQALWRHAERISDLARVTDQARADLTNLSDQTRVESQERAVLRKEIDATIVTMHRQEQDTSAIRRMAENSVTQLRDLTTGLGT